MKGPRNDNETIFVQASRNVSLGIVPCCEIISFGAMSDSMAIHCLKVLVS